MQELTEREQKLIEIIKKIINICTIMGLERVEINKIQRWANDAMLDRGLTNDWQNETLKYLEAEFGLVYTKINTDEKKEKDGNNS